MSDRRLTSPDLIAQLDTARECLDRSVDDLSHILDWRDEIAERIWRAQTVFMLVDTDHDFDQLINEVTTFKKVCRRTS